MRIAVPSTGKRKLSNKIAPTFSNTEHFTIVTLQDGKTDVQVISNPGYDQGKGRGPLAARTMKKLDVDLVISTEIGPGLKEILDGYGIRYKLVESGKTIKEIIEQLEPSDYVRGDNPQ